MPTLEDTLRICSGKLEIKFGAVGPQGKPGSGAGSTAWGDLSGNIENQTDLMDYTGGDYATFYQTQKVLLGGTP